MPTFINSSFEISTQSRTENQYKSKYNSVFYWLLNTRHNFEKSAFLAKVWSTPNSLFAQYKRTTHHATDRSRCHIRCGAERSYTRTRCGAIFARTIWDWAKSSLGDFNYFYFYLARGVCLKSAYRRRFLHAKWMLQFRRRHVVSLLKEIWKDDSAFTLYSVFQDFHLK